MQTGVIFHHKVRLNLNKITLTSQLTIRMRITYLLIAVASRTSNRIFFNIVSPLSSVLVMIASPKNIIEPRGCCVSHNYEGAVTALYKYSHRQR